MFRSICVLAILASVFATPAGAALIYDESVSGDLSNDGAAPTLLSVVVGENEVRGEVGKIGIDTDHDLYRFTVPTGAWLTSLRFDQYDESPDVAGGSFLAVASGTTISTALGSTQLSNTLIDSPGEWLDDLAAGAAFGAPSANVTGLTAPLVAGDYVIFLSEAQTHVDYTITATITAVPEPLSGVLVALGIAAAGMAARPARIPR